MKAIGFSVEGVLAGFSPQFPSEDGVLADALSRLTAAAGMQLEPAKLDAGRAILRRYDVRLRPRDFEVTFSHILEDLELCFLRPFIGPELVFARAFFPPIRGTPLCHADTLAAFKRLGRDHHLGACADVPFGMPRELLLAELHEAGLGGLLSAIVTSRDTGARFPSPLLLEALVADMQCEPGDFAYVADAGSHVQAALAFGCHSILIDRQGRGENWGQHRTIRSLEELGF